MIATSFAYGAFSTSHVAMCPDVAPVECSTTLIPDHEHHVRLALLHGELNTAYGLRSGLAFSLRLPYDIKDQHVRYTTVDGRPFVPPYGDIHHRTETLRGASDADLLFLWQPETHWRVGFGTTLPIGHTVPDPVRLGLQGKRHEHLQFGAGVFSPEAEIAWSAHNAAALLQMTMPITTNANGYKAPRNIRWTIGPSIAIGPATVGLSVAGQYQTIGRWHGALDEGTGFSNGGLRLHAVFRRNNVTFMPSIYREMYSHALNGAQGETFSQGTTMSLTIGRAF